MGREGVGGGVGLGGNGVTESKHARVAFQLV